MHYHILSEDLSGAEMLKSLVGQLIDLDLDTYVIKPYSGIGSIPKNLNINSNVRYSAILNDLPAVLKGLGKTFAGYGEGYRACVFIVCDLDDKDILDLTEKIETIVRNCNPPPETAICICVEEGEAWLLGDVDAIRTAYPNMKMSVIERYVQDSICGTWELLSEAIENIPKTRNKVEWARKISPHMEIARNKSPSFQRFVSKVKEYSSAA